MAAGRGWRRSVGAVVGGGRRRRGHGSRLHPGGRPCSVQFRAPNVRRLGRAEWPTAALSVRRAQVVGAHQRKNHDQQPLKAVLDASQRQQKALRTLPQPRLVP